MAENGTADLKKLNFVPEISTKGYTLATNAYATAKSYVPSPLQEQITRLEETVTTVGAPYVSKAQDKGTELLKAVDSRVDAVYQANTAFVQSVLEKRAEIHTYNLNGFHTARERYTKQIYDAVDFLRSKGLTGAAKDAIDHLAATAATARKIPEFALKQVHEAYERALTFEPVHKVLATTRPAVDAAYQRYDSLHAAVVKSQWYKQAYSLVEATATRAQDTFVYRRAALSLYPLVAKYADPALEQITASPYYQAAVTHIAPQA